MLDFLFQGDKEAVEEYSEALEEVRNQLMPFPQQLLVLTAIRCFFRLLLKQRTV